MDNFNNLLEAQKLHSRINYKQTLGNQDENARLHLELKVLQHYFAFSNFEVPFRDWLKEYLKDIL